MSPNELLFQSLLQRLGLWEGWLHKGCICGNALGLVIILFWEMMLVVGCEMVLQLFRGCFGQTFFCHLTWGDGVYGGLGYTKAITLLFWELDSIGIIARYIFTVPFYSHLPGFINHSIFFWAFAVQKTQPKTRAFLCCGKLYWDFLQPGLKL